MIQDIFKQTHRYQRSVFGGDETLYIAADKTTWDHYVNHLMMMIEIRDDFCRKGLGERLIVPKLAEIPE